MPTRNLNPITLRSQVVDSRKRRERSEHYRVSSRNQLPSLRDSLPQNMPRLQLQLPLAKFLS